MVQPLRPTFDVVRKVLNISDNAVKVNGGNTGQRWLSQLKNRHATAVIYVHWDKSKCNDTDGFPIEGMSAFSTRYFIGDLYARTYTDNVPIAYVEM